CSVRRMSFNRRPSFAGIVLVSRRSGAGNRGSGQGGQKSLASCAISSDEWAARIQSGERLGSMVSCCFEVAQSTVSKYMVKGGSPSQGWKTFFRNHAHAIAAIDLCVVPTLTFERLFAFLVLGHGRRQLLWFEVTRHPTAEWLARQITEAFPWASAPAYLVRDGVGGT